MEELAIEKLKREVEKLQIEIDNLKSPVWAYWRNPSSYLTALTVVVGVAAYIGQSYVSDAKAEHSKAELALVELKKKEFETENASLETRRKELMVEADRLKQETALQWSEYSKVVNASAAQQSELNEISKRLEVAQKELANKGQHNQTLTTAIGEVKKLDLNISKALPVLNARVYIQVASSEEAKDVTSLVSLLKTDDVVVPPIEVVGDKASHLQQTEVRYFWDTDKAEAESIATKLQANSKYGPVKVFLPAYLKGKTRPRHFEIWIKPLRQ